jgi:hypothetical protein
MLFLMSRQLASLDPKPPIGWLDESVDEPTAIPYPGAALADIRQGKGESQACHRLNHIVLPEFGMHLPGSRRSESRARSNHIGSLIPDIIGIATVGIDTKNETRTCFVSGEIKPDRKSFEAAVCRQIVYSLEVFDMCGGFGGLVVVESRLLRIFVLDKGLMAIESNDHEGETLHAKEVSRR